jgi:DNA-binding HxlR family transcriptional regulator
MNRLDILHDTPSDEVDFCTSTHLALVQPVLEKIADKWTILILTVVSREPLRFNEIKRRLGGITHKALSDALKRLERNGMVTRTVLPTSPVGVEYAITPLGLSLRDPFYALCSWALKHGPTIHDAGSDYDLAKSDHRSD